jgi:1,4-alpha-glucan branching enzyme
MLRKQNAAGGKVKVTFSMPALEGVTTLYLTGSFNDWSDPGLSMVRGADGGWSAALTLDAGWAYQYRFRDQDGCWHNDWAADDYVPNEFGSENSVADLTPPADVSAPKPAAPARKPAAKTSGKTAKPGAKPSTPRAKKS